MPDSKEAEQRRFFNLSVADALTQIKRDKKVKKVTRRLMFELSKGLKERSNEET